MKVALFTLLTSILFIFGSNNPAFAIDENELNEKLKIMAEQQGITDKKQLESLKSQVLSILKMQERFAYLALKDPCKEDIERFCSDRSDVSNSLECIKNNRGHVSNLCENALRNKFGSHPLKEVQLYNGVEIPKGSTFFYDPQGRVLGLRAAENFKYRNIHFKKGQIRFHDVGISVGHLVADQYIDGIKYKAGGIGPFFNKNGEVENATLSEDTEIEGITFKGGTQIQFYTKGKIHSGTVAKKVTIQGNTYMPNSGIWFNKNGEIRKY